MKTTKETKQESKEVGIKFYDIFVVIGDDLAGIDFEEDDEGVWCKREDVENLLSNKKSVSDEEIEKWIEKATDGYLNKNEQIKEIQVIMKKLMFNSAKWVREQLNK